MWEELSFSHTPVVGQGRGGQEPEGVEHVWEQGGPCEPLSNTGATAKKYTASVPQPQMDEQCGLATQQSITRTWEGVITPPPGEPRVHCAEGKKPGTEVTWLHPCEMSRIVNRSRRWLAVAHGWTGSRLGENGESLQMDMGWRKCCKMDCGDGGTTLWIYEKQQNSVVKMGAFYDIWITSK